MSSTNWSLDDDFRLNSAVLFYGTSNWSAVASNVSPRSDAECRERWQLINGKSKLRFRGMEEPVEETRPKPPKIPKVKAEEVTSAPTTALQSAKTVDGCKDVLDFSKLLASGTSVLDDSSDRGDAERKLDDFLDALSHLCDNIHPTTMDAMVDELVRRNNHLAAYLRDPFNVKPAYAGHLRPNQAPAGGDQAVGPPRPLNPATAPPQHPSASPVPPPAPQSVLQRVAKAPAGHPQALQSVLPPHDESRKLNLPQLSPFGSGQPPSLRLPQGPDFPAAPFVLPPTSPPLVTNANSVPLMDPATWAFPAGARRTPVDGAMPLPGPPPLLSPTTSLPITTLAMPPLPMSGSPVGQMALPSPALSVPLTPPLTTDVQQQATPESSKATVAPEAKPAPPGRPVGTFPVT
eukprot:GGOE01041382.1.p1 GENE.GGOE01041382.1~~GGOE01041382.1.p1  ORF type:complete len:404 (-),score=65.82 GGOE01041382.1:138-1349(-)